MTKERYCKFSGAEHKTALRACLPDRLRDPIVESVHRALSDLTEGAYPVFAATGYDDAGGDSEVATEALDQLAGTVGRAVDLLDEVAELLDAGKRPGPEE